jgi:putative endonuclease
MPSRSAVRSPGWLAAIVRHARRSCANARDALGAVVHPWRFRTSGAGARSPAQAGQQAHAEDRSTRRLGARGERLAARYLRRQGMRVVAKNLILGNAEADLVCLDRDRRTLVVVEVKARRTGAAGSNAGERTPEAAITERKRRKLLQLARSLAAQQARRLHGLDRATAARAQRPIRIDVVAVEFDASESATIRHHRDAVRA